MNPDGYNFIAFCDECKEKRSVSCSKIAASKGGSVLVGAIVCGHAWTVTPQESDKVRDVISLLAVS